MDLSAARMSFRTGAAAFLEFPSVIATERDGSTAPRQRAVTVPHQRAAFSYSASVEGLYPRTHGNKRPRAVAHETLHMVLRTATIYSDSDAVVARVWTMAPGFGTRVAATEVKLELAHAGNGETKTINCGTISHAGGLYTEGMRRGRGCPPAR